MADEESPEPTQPAPSWPLEPDLAALDSIDPVETEGRERLGSLAFTTAASQIREIVEILREAALDWDRFPTQVQTGATTQVQAVETLVQQIRDLTAESPNAAQTKTEIEQALQTLTQWFRDNVRPLCVTARIREEIASQSPVGRAADLNERIEATERRLQDLSVRERELVAQLESVAPLLEATRDATSASGAAELGVDYTAQAKAHNTAWKLSLRLSLLAVVVAGLGSFFIVWGYHPSNEARNGEIVSKLAVDLLIIGLLLYVVRIAFLQFRVHRHLEVIALNKAAALSTFNRIVSAGVEPAVREALASILAQAVFDSSETGFIDATSEHVTLIERFAAPIASRLSP